MSGGNLRFYRQKIKSTETLEKVFRAMEMIAASRIGAARARAMEADPYTQALTKAVAAVALRSEVRHPLTSERTDTNRVAVLVIASDRGLAGSYTATLMRETERLIQELIEQGKEPVLFTAGKRATQYFGFKGVPIERSWEGNSDQPTDEQIEEVGRTMLEYFLDEDPQVGVSALELVFTRFISMMSQVPEIRQMLPLTVVDAPREEDEKGNSASVPAEMDERGFPEYEFIPDVDSVLDTLLPLYVTNRIANAMMQAAASELAARQQAMHSATENARDLVNDYTRMANAARQAEITQEISEIVSGADALAQ